MITCDKGHVKMNGPFPIILSECTVVIRSIFEILTEKGMPEELAKRLIQKAYDTAFMSNEEIEKSSNEAKSNMSNDLRIVIERLAEALQED